MSSIKKRKLNTEAPPSLLKDKSLKKPTVKAAAPTPSPEPTKQLSPEEEPEGEDGEPVEAEEVKKSFKELVGLIFAFVPPKLTSCPGSN